MQLMCNNGLTGLGSDLSQIAKNFCTRYLQRNKTRDYGGVFPQPGCNMVSSKNFTTAKL